PKAIPHCRPAARRDATCSGSESACTNRFPPLPRGVAVTHCRVECGGEGELMDAVTLSFVCGTLLVATQIGCTLDHSADLPLLVRRRIIVESSPALLPADKQFRTMIPPCPVRCKQWHDLNRRP